MARIRTVKPQFFRSYELYQAEVETNKSRTGPYLNLRVAFLGLITAADREGRFKWRPEELKLDCLPYDPVDFNDAMAALSAGSDPFIVKYETPDGVFGWIPGFSEHQRPHPEEAKSKLPEPSLALDDKNPNELQLESDRTPGVVQSSLGRESGVLSLENGDKALKSAKDPKAFQVLMDRFLVQHLGLQPGVKDQRAKVSAAYRRYGKAAKDLMAMSDGDPEKAMTAVNAIGSHMKARGLSWTLDTVAKHALDYFKNPSAYNGKSGHGNNGSHSLIPAGSAAPKENKFPTSKVRATEPAQ